MSESVNLQSHRVAQVVVLDDRVVECLARLRVRVEQIGRRILDFFTKKNFKISKNYGNFSKILQSRKSGNGLVLILHLNGELWLLR